MSKSELAFDKTDGYNLEEINQKEKEKNNYRRATRFIFSNIGLVVVVILYTIIGAFIFLMLEEQEEIKICEESRNKESYGILNLKGQLLTYIHFNVTSDPIDLSKDNETVANQNIENWLADFRDKVLTNQGTFQYIGHDCKQLKWNFANSLLFAVTIITTIGYGQIYPITWEGQLVCIFYAIIGIPMFLICVTNLSGLLGDMVRFLYASVCCRLCFKKKKSNTKILNESKQKIDGNHTKIETKNAVLSSETNETENNYQKSINRVIDDTDLIEKELNNEEDEEEEKISVPLTITIIIMAIYMFVGAFLFNLSEGWDLVESAYFCFITVATIGFGDFVPGQKFDDPMQGPKLLVAAAYLLIGIATLAMCFDLMQEEIIAKLTWLGKRLGIMDKEEEEEQTVEDEVPDKFQNDETTKKPKEIQSENYENEKNIVISSKLSFVDEKSIGYNGIAHKSYQSSA